MNWWLVALGGALGSVARYGTARLWTATPAGLPIPTLTVNLVGSFAIGLLYVWFSTRSGLGNESARLFWMTGVLGGFTTYSAFALESTMLGFSVSGLVYVLLTLVGCLAMAWLGRLAGALLLAQP